MSVALEKGDIDYPPIEGYEHVVEHFHESGKAVYTGMGIAPLTWQEIDSWLSVTSLQIPVWERLLIKNMSESYVGEYNQADDPNRPAPYTKEVKILDREQLGKDLKAAFQSFKRDKK